MTRNLRSSQTRHGSVSRVMRKVVGLFTNDRSPPPSPPLSPRASVSSSPSTTPVERRRAEHVDVTPSPNPQSTSGWRKGSRRQPNASSSILGWLKVSVVQAKILDIAYMPSLFVQLEMGTQIYRTRTVNRSVCPMWNANFIFDVLKDNSPTSPELMANVEEQDSSGAAPLKLKLFHKSSPVNKVLVGVCDTVDSLTTYIAPTTIWVFVQTEKFERGIVVSTNVAEIQLSLQFMGAREGIDADKQRQEQILRDLRREWILSQKLSVGESDENPPLTARRKIDGDNIDMSSHAEDDLDEMTEYVSLATSIRDGGYVFDNMDGDNLTNSGTHTTTTVYEGEMSLHLSGSGETSLSEDVNHYIKSGARIPLKPGSVASLVSHARESVVANNSNSNNNSNVNTSPASTSQIKDLGDFNIRFQQTVDRMRDIQHGVVEKLTCNINLVDLAQDFMHSASAYGKIIISEYELFYFEYFFYL